MSVFVRPFKITAAIIITILSCACGKKNSDPKAPPVAPPPIVDVIVAQPQSISDTIEANGSVIANDYVQLRPEVSGRITFLDVPEGKFITKGTVIARINDADLEAQLNKTKVLLDLAVKTEDRYKKLLAVNGLNQSDYDVALNTVNGYKADLEYTQSLIDKTIIKAPFDGVAGLRMVSIGASVSPTDVIASIQDVGRMKVDFTIPEQYGSLIIKGNAVDIVSDAGNAHIKAVIIATEPQVDQNTRNIKVRTLLENSRLSPGSFVKVYVITGTNKNAIMVPTNAIIPEDINNELIVVKKGKAILVNIQTGIRQANNIEVTRGINAGDTVVVTGVLFARPKSPVKIRKVLTLGKFGN